MGLPFDPEIAAALDAGSWLITASERTARELTLSYSRLQTRRGRAGWLAPTILPWQQFLLRLWRDFATASPCVLLTSLTEQSLWATCAGSETELATTLEASRQRLGKLALDAHALLALYAPEALDPRARADWQRDQAAFSRWLETFDHECRTHQLLSTSRLPLELLPLLAQPDAARPPLLLAGFDRIQPVQRRLFDAWGPWRQLPLAEATAQRAFYSATDENSELTACALWCRSQLERDPEARLILLTHNQERKRGQIERALRAQIGPAFEFSLGMPLDKTALIRSARLLLGWLTQPIDEQALDTLIVHGYTTETAEEQSALLRRMSHLRLRGRGRPSWTLDAFLSARCDAPAPPAWAERLRAARSLLETRPSPSQSPLDWAELLPRLLAAAGWPGGRPLTSAEFQLHDRFEEALETCASFGLLLHPVGWKAFLALLDHALAETLFTAESHSAPVLIAGPAETAGLAADGIWFLGATEDAWPATGVTHPFLPLALQRDHHMPHAHPSIDWELAETMSRRLLASSSQLVFSYPRQLDGAEAHPSRLALRFAGAPKPLPGELLSPPAPASLALTVEDRSRIPYPPGSAPGGSNLITNQSTCPFRAFATARLGARSWEPAEAGLTAAQRGSLLHAVLHSIWSGPPEGLRTHADLIALSDRTAFVRRHVERVFDPSLPDGARSRMPHRYLDLEQERLISLVGEWLAFEAARVPFTVQSTELETETSIESLALRLRLDRIDRLSDGTLLILDYKSGDLLPKLWETPRPEDAQLPLYAAFGQIDGELGGLVFAKLRAGEPEFAGRVARAAETLLPTLKASSALLKQPFTVEMLLDWRDAIAALARAFIEGQAQVDPRDYPSTCSNCELASLCRIRDFPPLSESEEAIDA